MKRIWRIASGLALVGFLAPAFLPAQANTTITTAASLAWGQKVTTSMGTGQRWYYVVTTAGRSYCLETGNVEHMAEAEADEDTVLTAYDSEGSAVIAFNDDTVTEPLVGSYSRLCYVPSVLQAGVNFIKVEPKIGVLTQLVTLRAVETTLFCPWFFIAGDYNAFSLLRNTSDLPLTVYVTWRGLSGAIAGTTSVSVPANGTSILNARTFVNPGAFSNGSVEVAHAGSPQQIMGSTTTLSGTTGLGFDAMFEQRKPW